MIMFRQIFIGLRRVSDEGFMPIAFFFLKILSFIRQLQEIRQKKRRQRSIYPIHINLMGC